MNALTSLQSLIQSLQPSIKILNKFLIFKIPALQWLLALGAFAVLLLLFRFFRRHIVNNLKKLGKKTQSNLYITLVEFLDDIPTHFYQIVAAFIAFYPLAANLENKTAASILKGIFLIFVMYRGILFLQKFLGYMMEKTLMKNEENETALHGVKIILNIALWLIGTLVILQNLGFEVSTLVTSLGIGGVAVAFALQNVLGDLFSSFAIYFDKPFQIGDHIVLGTDSGTVKKIGLKTTRITTLQGEELVVSNAELTSARIKNFKRMKKRRVSFAFGVTYATPTEKLKKIPKIVDKIITSEKLTEVERIHFKAFGDFSLNFEVVYFVKSREYNDYMDIQQSINLALMDAFEKEKIEMAFPTQTIFLAK